MSVVGRIAALEWTGAWRARSTHVLCVLLAALTLVTAVIGIRRLHQDDAQRRRYQELVDAQWTDQPDRHPHRVAHYGFLVFRPRPMWSSFDEGVEAFAGTSLFLEAHRRNLANFSDAQQSDGILRFGHLTPAVVLQVLVPLVIFVVGATVVSREREAGTLAMVLSQGPPMRTVLTGKLLGTLGVVLTMVAPAALAAFVIGGWHALHAGTPDGLARLAGLAGVHVLFAGLCAAGAVLVSARHSTSRGALLTLLTVWIGLWVVAPRMLPALAQALHPSPSRAAFEAQVEARVRELGDSHNPNDPRFLELRESYLKRFGVKALDELPINYNGVVMQEGEKHTAEAYREALGQVQGLFDRQTSLMHVASWLNPFLAMRHVSMALAGVDLAHVRHFEDAAEAYRYALIQHLNALHADEVAYARDRYLDASSSDAPSRQRIDRTHFAQAPEFNYQPPGVGWALRNVWMALLALVTWTAATAIAFRAAALPLV